MYYKLIRNTPEGKAVHGKLYRVSHYYNKRTGLMVERLHPICDTLENADYLVPALIPGRSGIRFHRGSLPEHSKGCILISASMEQSLTARWLSEQSASEETRLEICNNINYYRNEKRI